MLLITSAGMGGGNVLVLLYVTSQKLFAACFPDLDWMAWRWTDDTWTEVLTCRRKRTSFRHVHHSPVERIKQREARKVLKHPV